jgi:glycosyltransferase involved in cell wall biosynthesis
VEKQEKKGSFHVVYILTKLELGGAQKVCLSLMEGMEKNNYTTSLITGPEGSLVSHARHFDSVFFLNNFKREISIKGLWGEIKNFFAIIATLRKIKKQHKEKTIIVHTHSTKAGLVGRWAAFFARISHRVHTIHGYGFHDHQAWFIWWPVYVLELCTSFITTHFICVSNHDMQQGMKLFPRFSKKSSLIRASVAWDQFYQPATKTKMLPLKNSSVVYIGTVSCFKPQKNILDLFKAFEAVCLMFKANNMPLPVLEVIGDGEQRPILEQWIIDHNLSNQITLLGWQKDVAIWMRGWHLFVMSSLWEGLPCSVIEARLCKLPVISYAIGGIPEVIIHGKNGYIINPSNWEGLAESMGTVLKDRLLFQSLSSCNDDLSQFDNQVMWQKHISLYCDFARI